MTSTDRTDADVMAAIERILASLPASQLARILTLLRARGGRGGSAPPSASSQVSRWPARPDWTTLPRPAEVFS